MSSSNGNQVFTYSNKDSYNNFTKVHVKSAWYEDSTIIDLIYNCK